MKKTTLLITISLILLALPLISFSMQNPQGDIEAYRIASETQDVAQKAQKLDAFVKQYPDSTFAPLAYLNLIGIYDQQSNCAQLTKFIDEADSKGMLAKAGVDDAGLAKIYYRAYDCVKSQGKQAGVKYLDKIINLAQQHNGDTNWQTTLTQVQNLKKSLTAPPPKPKEPPVNAAIRSYNDKKYADAAAAFEKLDQKDAKVANYYGLTLFRLKKYPEAVKKIVTAALLDGEAYPKALDTAKTIFTTSVYKASGNKAYNDRLKEITEKANKDMEDLNKAFNDKWAEKEIEEGSDDEKQYDLEYEKLQNAITRVQTNAQEDLAKLAAQLDKAFDDLVAQIQKELK